jgi:hypothetical protein
MKLFYKITSIFLCVCILNACASYNINNRANSKSSDGVVSDSKFDSSPSKGFDMFGWLLGVGVFYGIMLKIGVKGN